MPGVASEYKTSNNSKQEKDKTEELVEDFNRLRGDRGVWESHWREIAERMYPSHKDLFTSQGSSQTKGDKRNQERFDSTGLLALKRFGAILDSLLTPRNSTWHRLVPNNDGLKKSKIVQDYFQQVNEVLFKQRYLPPANFSSQNQLQYLSLGAYGTGALFIDDEKNLGGVRYKNIHLSQLFMQENHQGIVDRVCRHFCLTARQAQKFFRDSLPKQILDDAGSSPNKEHFFLHWVIPNDDIEPFSLDFKGMPFISLYVSLTEKKLLSEGGYNTFPYAVSRYEQTPEEAYGRSIAMDVLPEQKILNEQKKTLLKQGHLAVDPVILSHDDGILDIYNGMPGSIIPGGVSKDGKMLVQPMPVGAISLADKMMEEERRVINDSFLITLFQILVETPQATATEVMEKAREKGILLAPSVGRQQSEYLGPVITREIDILSRQNKLPPQPQVLKEAQGEFEIVYESPLNRTQRAEWAAGAMRTVELALQLATQTQDMSYLDHFNFDVMIPAVSDINGTPSTWLNDKKQIQAVRQARSQQQQQQQMIEAAPAVAGLAKSQR